MGWIITGPINRKSKNMILCLGLFLLNIIKALLGSGEAEKILGSIYREVTYNLSTIPSKNLDEVFPGIEKIPVILNPSRRYGLVSCYELYVLCAIAKYKDVRRVFEIGTFTGNTIYHLALNTNPQTHLFTLDLPRNAISNQLDQRVVHEYKKGILTGERFIGTPLHKKITQLYGDSKKLDFSPYFDSIDMIFIDGNHGYEYVKSDTLNALRMLRKSNKSVIIWHDYIVGSDVAKVIEETSIRAIWIKRTNMAIYIHNPSKWDQ